MEHLEAIGELIRRVRARWRLVRLGEGVVRAALAATVGSCLSCVLLLTGVVHGLDPNKRLTQYMHTSWRIQDGSAPSSMYSVTQTTDGFLWFLSNRGEIYRFDGVQFRLWRKPADAGAIGGSGTSLVIGQVGSGHWEPMESLT